MPIRIIRDALTNELKDKYFYLTVDLGCGDGQSAPIIRPHTDYLMGIDITEEYLDVAGNRGLYDSLIWAKVQEVAVPKNCDAVVMTEVLEHIPHEDGEQILETFSTVPFMIVSTPRFLFSVSVPYKNYGQHISLWTEGELQKYGFGTTILFRPFFPQIIWAVRNI